MPCLSGTESKKPSDKLNPKPHRTAALFTKPGYWITPAGRMIRVHPDHLAFVQSHPDLFGFTRQEFDSICSYHRDILQNGGKVREAIIRDIVLDGFIRVRRYAGHWSINVPHLTPAMRESVTRFAAEILQDGVDGTVETDPETPLTILCVKTGIIVNEWSVHEVATGALLLPEPVHPPVWIGDPPDPALDPRAKRSWRELRRRFRYVEAIFEMVNILVANQASSLTTIRDRVLQYCKIRNIDFYLLLSYVVDSQVSAVTGMIGRRTIRRFDADLYLESVQTEPDQL